MLSTSNLSSFCFSECMFQIYQFLIWKFLECMSLWLIPSSRKVQTEILSNSIFLVTRKHENFFSVVVSLHCTSFLQNLRHNTFCEWIKGAMRKRSYKSSIICIYWKGNDIIRLKSFALKRHIVNNSWQNLLTRQEKSKHRVRKAAKKK